MDNKQEQRDGIERKIRELETEQAKIDIQDKTLADWDTEREDKLQKEIAKLRLELEKLNTNQTDV